MLPVKKVLSRWPKGVAWRAVVDTAVSVLLLVASVVVLWKYSSNSGPSGAIAGTRAREDTPVPARPLNMEGAGSRGAPTATVGMVVFSDFQCPFCGRFARDLMPVLEEHYIKPGTLKLVFRHLPLPRHALAVTAAEAAECAGRQGAFWVVHDAMFRREGPELTAERIGTIARDAGVQMKEFEACMGDSGGTRVDEDRQLAAELNVVSTPLTFVGRMLPSGELEALSVVRGAAPIEHFRRAIDEARRQGGVGWRLWRVVW